MGIVRRDIVDYIANNQEKFYRIAFAHVKNREDALDIVHDSVVKALQNYQTLRQPEYMQTWFFRILTNESVSFLRKNRRTIPFGDFSDSEITENGGLAPDDCMDLYRALDQLPPKLKTVVILRFFEDMKLEEIGKATGVNLSTVKSRLYRALKILKLDLEVADND